MDNNLSTLLLETLRKYYHQVQMKNFRPIPCNRNNVQPRDRNYDPHYLEPQYLLSGHLHFLMNELQRNSMAEHYPVRFPDQECAANLHLRRQDLLSTRTAAIDVVLAHQKAIVQLDQELEENSKDIKNVPVHFISERETILSIFVGSLLKEKKKAAEVQPDAPQFIAPRHTPTIVCFLRTHLNQPGMVSCGCKIRECDGFMLQTNRERMELLFAQHRCFGCFLPLSVAGHLKLADCPHPRFCAMCGTNDHHQILCAPRRYLWTGGPAVTYSAALTGRIVGGKGLRIVFTLEVALAPFVLVVQYNDASILGSAIQHQQSLIIFIISFCACANQVIQKQAKQAFYLSMASNQRSNKTAYYLSY
ncbi:hypothetical protein OUZ56_025325 [Daphnia magna]|uniref:Uncharacterized protein n=1 Tax=Daphnia magna TaxID=35525 RepID=A0ABQ9ZJI1_9CRUS|nr:hypothetical protein OUZ56_025325 [Daphnia magna]